MQTDEERDTTPGEEEPAAEHGSPPDGPVEEADALKEPAAEAEEPAADADAQAADAAERAPEPPTKPATAPAAAKAVPGADLDPIRIEESGRELTAEERARLEAEAEERAAREAAATADGEPEEPVAARSVADLAKDARYGATGKRKNAIARVRVQPGKGAFVVNGRELAEFFPRPTHQVTARQPLAATGYEGTVDVQVSVQGGGVSGQAGAVRHGIARALTEIDPELRGELKRRGFLSRDARIKERRKAGLKKARKRPQFSKR